MFKNSFVSLYFSDNRLDVVKLSADKKKAETYLSVDIPEGLIKKHTVQDVSSMSAFLKNVWKKLKLNENAVGLVLPEFLTFTKNVKIPKLKAEELNEAIEWQVREFFPKNLSDLSVDWKITEQTENEFGVLVVAIDREVLKSYVDSVSGADLFPLYIETQSLSLVRLTQNYKFGKLIVHFQGETVLVVAAFGEKVLGSSSVAMDVDEIVRTSKKMMAFYDDLEIKEIFIGGEGINDAVIADMAKKLNIHMELLSHKVSNLNTLEGQKYLIPISSQFEKPSDPSNQLTINLLPKNLVDIFRRKRTHQQVWSMLSIVTLFVWSLFFVVLGSYLFLNQRVGKLREDNSSILISAVKTQEGVDKIKTINETSSKIIRINKSIDDPQDLLNKIYLIKPEGVVINKYEFDFEFRTVSVEGVSDTRIDLINFKRSLEETGMFTQVVLPLSNLETERNLEFKISFLYLDNSKK